ncbi:MAG TPA: hypothetical protein VI653_14890, partial [Steroidobacteraceae bacterium]
MAIRINSDASTIKRSANTPTRNAFTLAGWFNFSSFRNGSFWGPLGIYNGTDGTPGASSPYLQISSDTSTGNGVLDLWWPDSGNNALSATLFTAQLGTWYFIALTGSGTGVGNVNAYVRSLASNALTVATNSTTTNTFTPNRMEWGRDGFSGDQIDGSAFGCVAFDRALTSRELLILSYALIQERIPDDTSLNVYYRLRGNGDIYDLS